MGFPGRQTSEASSTTSTAPPATPASYVRSLPQCGSLATMDVPWSPMSHVDGDGVRRLGDDDVDLDDEEDFDARTNDDGDDDDEELGEFVCYGDRVCLLCDGQLLALTRKFNLSYQQMALLATATLVSGGLLGVASLLIWRKGLFRKRYAALLSDLVYRDAQGGDKAAATTTKALLERHMGQMSSAYDASAATQQPTTAHEDDDVVTRVPPATGGSSDTSKTLRKKAQAVTFRIFEYDPVSHAIKYGSLGQPVQFGAPVVVAHAASRRAIRYKPHRGAVTISRPPRNPHFRRDVKEGVALIDASLAQSSRWSETPTKDSKEKDGAAAHKQRQKERPKSLTTTIVHRVLRGGGSRQATDEAAVPPSSWRSRSARDPSKAATTLANAQPPASLGPLRATTWSDPTTATNHSEVAMRRRASQPPHFRGFTSETAATASDARQPAPEPRRGSVSVSASASRNLYRSISESCLTLMRNLNDSVQQQKERHVLKKRRRLLLKDLPNMAFPERDGKYFVARLQAPVVPLFRSESAGFPKVPPVELPSYLRWGAPMQLVADYNGNPCGFHSREYYRDAQQYMSTEGTNCSPATIIPIPENGNLQAIAKESVRRVANMERRQVRLRVGTYNVWMMPRKISMFASVSPKKNTRAKLIADVLPPCDIWVFTECFDHRARNVLLDKLKRSGGYYFNSPTVGHKRRGPDGRYLDKLLNGGVVLASKYPILSVRIKLFREVSAGSDRFADKGVLYCKILKDGLLVHVFSTHLQAWNDQLSRSARRQQLKIIAEMMESMGIDETVDCVLYVGDLNVNMWLNKQNGEYDEMLELLDAHDAARGAPATTPQEATEQKPAAVDFKRKQQFSFDGRLNPLASDGPSSDGSLELLDYVLYSKSHRQPAQAMSYVQPIFATAPWVWKKTPQYHLSDHFPVISELTFDMWRE